jgi:hypothetical protein
MSSFKHLHLLAEDDDDPMLSAVNLVDVFLVLVVALLTAVAAQSSRQPQADERVTIIKNAGSPDMEVIVRENGKEVKFKGAGQAGAGQGERAGVAYKLKDGNIVYVPEPAGAPAASTDHGAAKGPQ